MAKRTKPASTEPDTSVEHEQTLGELADKLWDLREQRRELQREADKISEQEVEVKNLLIDRIPKSDATGVAGKKARVTIVTKQVPRVQDWDAFYKHVHKTKSFELLQRRVSEASVKERWEDGKEVPGVAQFTVVDVSIKRAD